jgi:hypothetical protein
VFTERFRTSRRARATSAGAVAIVAATATLFGAAEPAEACTWLPPGPPELIGLPSEGVPAPTDVLPTFDRAHANMSAPSSIARFVLRTADTVIPLTPAYPYPSVFTLAPPQPLQPNTSYVLEATLPVRTGGTVTDTVTFTTGGGAAAPPGPPHGVFLQNFLLTGAVDTCDPRPGTCVAIPYDVVATPANLFGQETGQSDLWQSSRFTVLTQSSPHGDPSGCMSFRARGQNGALSEPVVRCAATSPAVVVNAEKKLACTATGITENGAPAQGCSVSRSATSGNGMAGVAAMFALLAASRLKARREAKVTSRSPRKNCRRPREGATGSQARAVNRVPRLVQRGRT